MALGALLVSAAGLTGCSSAPSPVPPPAPVPSVAPLPRPIEPARPAEDWRDRPITEGTWSWRKDGTRSVASFARGNYQLFSMTCDPAARQVTLRSAMLNISSLAITTTSVHRVLPARADETVRPMMTSAVLSARDPLLDAMAFSRGRFMVSALGNADYLPSWPEVSRVIEDCR